MWELRVSALLKARPERNQSPSLILGPCCYHHIQGNRFPVPQLPDGVSLYPFGKIFVSLAHPLTLSVFLPPGAYVLFEISSLGCMASR